MKIALSKGRLSADGIKLFQKAKMAKGIDLNSRKLVFHDPDYNITYLLLKPNDVVTYVEKGIVDLGIVGSDVIMESDQDVLELCDLEFGKCKFSIATKRTSQFLINNKFLKVATKYPNITKRHFEKRNQSIEIISLKGSVELAPLMGFADCIVDLVETGKTLEANDLCIVEDLHEVSARLISNPIQYRFYKNDIMNLINKLKECL